MRERTKKKIKKGIKILIIIFIIVAIYGFGMVRGLIEGMAMSEKRHNSTMCDLFGKERDTDGFCILHNGTGEDYRVYLDCGYELFKINGSKKAPFVHSTIYSIQKIVYYPLLGCV